MNKSILIKITSYIQKIFLQIIIYKKALFFMFISIFFIFIVKYSFFSTTTESFQNRDNWYVEKNYIKNAYIGSNQKKFIGILGEEINIYDMETKKLVQKLGGHKDFIIASKLSHGSQFFVSLSSRKIKVWNVKTNMLIKEISLDKIYSVGDVSISRNGETLITASPSGEIVLKDIESGTILYSFQHGKKTISSIVLSEDEKVLLSGSWDGSIKIWDLEKNILAKTINTNRAEERSICDVKISENKQLIVSSSYFTIDTWNIDGKHLQTLDTYDFKHTLVDISPNGKRIVSIGDSIKIWEEKDGEFILTYQYKNSKHNTSPIHISNDSDMVAIGGKIIDLNSGEVIKEIGSHLKEIKSLHINNDAKTLIVNSEGSSSFWDLDNAKLIKTFKENRKIFEDEIQSNNQKIGLSYNDNIIKIRDLNSLEVIETITYEIANTSIVAKAISNNKENIILANYEGDLLIWNKNRTTPKVIKQVHDAYISSITFSDDGESYVTTSRDGGIKIWDLKDNFLKRMLKAEVSVNCVALSSDGKYLVSGSGANYTNFTSRQLSDSYVKLWELETGILLKTYVGHKDTISAVAMSADNKYIVASTASNVINVWETKYNSHIKEFMQDNKNNWVAFDYQNKLLTKDDDGTFLYKKKSLKQGL